MCKLIEVTQTYRGDPNISMEMNLAHELTVCQSPLGGLRVWETTPVQQTEMVEWALTHAEADLDFCVKGGGGGGGGLSLRA